MKYNNFLFVLVAQKENYYTSFVNSKSYSNVLKVPLQQNTYKHIATFPEKLITSLILTLTLPQKATIMDPFAGSGTTTVAIKNYNEQKNKNYDTISIEAKLEFVEIIQSRCNIPKNYIIKIPYTSTLFNVKSDCSNKLWPLNKDLFNNIQLIDYRSPLLIIKTYLQNNFDKIYEEIHNDDFIDLLDDNGIFIPLYFN